MKIVKSLLLSFLLVIAGLLVWAFYIPEPSLNEITYSFRLLDHKEKELRRFTTQSGDWRLPIEVADVDPRFISLLLAYEDKRFYQHNGADFIAILRAAGQLVLHRKIISGASTLTMQTVRLLNPRSRTLKSKFIEIVQAVKLEKKHSKKDILKMYLTLAPFGGNIQGVRAAALIYFGKEPKRLTLSEIALLIALPQSPEVRRPDRYRHRATVARDFVINHLQQKGLLNRIDADLAIAESLPSKRVSTPFSAAHLASFYQRDLARKKSNQTHLVSTINKKIQQRLEGLANRQNNLTEGESFAIMVVSNKDRKVIAHLGSGSFINQSQLDLTKAIRSPGSTLKPFIYGLGFEKNLMHPETLVRDTAYRTGTYKPKNYDGTYKGTVSIRTALQKSLNIPAVKALQKVGPNQLLDRFSKVGVELKLPAHHKVDLSIALGGVGITLADLVGLYSALPNGGQYQSLRYQKNERFTRAQLLSPTAAWYLNDILSQTLAPEGFIRNQKVRYKTGTSYGFRDAWAIGYDSNYTVGVWVGHPDNSAGKNRTGRKRAAPLLFETFELLPQAKPGRHFFKPDGVQLVVHKDLPKNLQWLSPQVLSYDVNLNSPKITYPLNQSELVLEEEQDVFNVVVLKAQSGQAPFHWLINGEVLPNVTNSHHAQWQPDGEGQFNILLIDANGEADHASVWISKKSSFK